MNVQTAAILTAVKTLNLLLGGSITLYAYRAYRRTDSSALLALALGFAIITVGALIAGTMDQLLTLDTDTALVVEGIFTAAGFGTILYSIHQ